MSTVEQDTQARSNGAGAKTIPVTNKATGELMGHGPDLDRDQIGELAARARKAQPGWDAIGFEGRAEVMFALRRWLVANSDRLLQTISDENGKVWEDAQLELFYTADALSFWGKRAKKYLKDQTFRPHSPFLIGAKAILRYRPYGVVGVIGPWNYPLINNFGDAIPALMAGNTVLLKPSSITPDDLAPGRRGHARDRRTRRCLPRRLGRRRNRVGGGRLHRHGPLHRLDRDRQEDHGPGGRDGHAGDARAGQQRPDARAAPTPTSTAPPAPRSSTRCRTAGRPASRSSASTSRSRSTRSSSPRSPSGPGPCARECRPAPAAWTSAR